MFLCNVDGEEAGIFRILPGSQEKREGEKRRKERREERTARREERTARSAKRGEIPWWKNYLLKIYVFHTERWLSKEPSLFAKFTLSLCMIKRVMENLGITPSYKYNQMKNMYNIELSVIFFLFLDIRILQVKNLNLHWKNIVAITITILIQE